MSARTISAPHVEDHVSTSSTLQKSDRQEEHSGHYPVEGISDLLRHSSPSSSSSSAAVSGLSPTAFPVSHLLRQSSSEAHERGLPLVSDRTDDATDRDASSFDLRQESHEVAASVWQTSTVKVGGLVFNSHLFSSEKLMPFPKPHAR